MQHWNPDPQPWYILPVTPGAEPRLRRWDIIIISILAALVLSLFLTAVVPQTPSSAAHHAPGKTHHVS